MALIYLAGGGTGGHLFPGLAVAEALTELCPSLSVEFIGTREGMDQKLVSPSGYPLRLLAAGRGSPLAWRRPLNAPKFAWSLWQCRKLFRAGKPAAVVGLGGFAAGAPGLMARLGKTPLYLLEPNAVPGRVNRWLSGWAKGVFLQFEAARTFFEKTRGWVEVSGSPLRPAFSALAREEPMWGDTIAVLGGSQGAKRLNDLFIAGAPRVTGTGARIVHVAGPAHAAEVRKVYERLGIAAEVQAFCDDMPGLLRQAGLVVARSGAGSLSEFAAAGVPAILLPLSTAKDDHQRANARAVAANGAAKILEETKLNGGELGDAVAALWGDLSARRRMGLAMRALVKPHAAHIVARKVLEDTGLLKA